MEVKKITSCKDGLMGDLHFMTSSVVSHLALSKEYFGGLKRWLISLEHLKLFQESQVRFPASTLGSS